MLKISQIFGKRYRIHGSTTHKVRWLPVLQRKITEGVFNRKTNDGFPANFEADEDMVRTVVLDLFKDEFKIPGAYIKEYALKHTDIECFKKTSRCCDIAIFRPHNSIEIADRHVFAYIEIKRTYDSDSKFISKVLQDVLRLAILSKQKNCCAYLLICGNTKNVENELQDPRIKDILKTTIGQNNQVEINSIDLESDNDYLNFCNKNNVNKIHSLFVIRADERNGTWAGVWQISQQEEKLSTDSAYEYLLASPYS